MRKLVNRRKRTHLAAAVACLATPLAARAATADWKSPVSGNYWTGTNWSTGTAPFSSADTARFNTGAAASYTVTLNATSANVGALSVLNDNLTFDLVTRTYTVASATSIGSAPGGSLAVTNGTLSTNWTYVGFAAGELGSYTLSATRWTENGGAVAGNLGNGSLSLTNGATLTLQGTSSTVSVGWDRASTGSLTVDGVGSSILSQITPPAGSTGSAVIVGASGHATASVTNGAKIAYAGTSSSHPSSYVAYYPSSVGTVTIDGPGSQWSDLNFIGYSGDGSATVSNGGTLSSTGTLLGYNAHSKGAVLVDGANSRLSTPWITVANGATSTGALTIQNGAKATGLSDLTTASAVGAAATVTVDGQGSMLAAASTMIGAAGTGTLSVTGGATLSTSSATLAHVAGSSATAVIDGTGSTFANTNTLIIGDAGRATLSARNGATLSTTDVRLAQTSTAAGSSVSLDGANTKWTISGTASFAIAGQSAVSLTNGATATSGYLVLGSDTSFTPAIPNSLSIDGTGSSWSVSSQFGRTNVGFNSPSAVSVTNGAALGTVNTSIGRYGSATVSGTGSSWTASGSSFATSGSLLISAGATVTDVAPSTTLGGTLTVTGSGTKWTGQPSAVLLAGTSAPLALTVSDGASFSTASDVYLSTASATVTGSGSTWANAGTLTLATPASGTTSATITGGGTLSCTSATLNGRAAVSVADAGSRWSMSGNLTMSYSSTLAISNGAAVSNATAQLNGALNLPAAVSLTGPSSWSTAGSLYVGGTSSAVGGAGQVSLAGGSASVTGTARLWNSAGTSLSLTAASFTTGALALNAAPGPSTPGAITLTGRALALGTGALYLGGDASGASAPASLAVSPGGSVTLAGPLVLWGPASLSLNGGTLSLDSATPLLLWHYAGTSPADTLRQYLSDGLLSTTAADATHRLGYLDVDSSVTAQLALAGDANLDGTINSDDFALIDRGRASGGTLWWQGDFNYDGTIDQNDYLLLDTTYGQAQGFSPGFLSTRESQFGPAYISELLGAVPEPASLATLLASFPLFTRRRIRHTAR